MDFTIGKKLALLKVSKINDFCQTINLKTNLNQEGFFKLFIMNTLTGKFPFIVFEGLDGAGKTTLARMLAEQQSLSYFTSIPQNLVSLKPLVDDTSSPIATFHFYSLCNSIRSQEYASRVKTSTVIADRYVFSTLAYHSLLLQQDLSYHLEILKSEPKFLMPNIIVYVTASDEVISQRITNRSKNTSLQWYGDFVTINLNLADSYKLIFDLVDIPIIHIDTSKDSLQESYNLLRQKLREIVEINFNFF